MWVYVIIGYGNEEQCYHSHKHLQAKVVLYGREQRPTRFAFPEGNTGAYKAKVKNSK